MARIILESWREGLEKVSLTKLQIEKLGISLKNAKHNVDCLLDGEKIVLEVVTNDQAEDFFQAAQRIGVNCKLVKD